MSPPISLFLTTIASQPALRQKQEGSRHGRIPTNLEYSEYLLRILQAKKIPFTSYDLASDEDAKRLWKRKTPLDKQQLPGILVGYQFVGTFAQFEEAVEYNELDQFLKLKEPWDPSIDEERPPPAAKTIGVPGAQLPMQMTPDHIKKHIIAEQQSPLRVKNKLKQIPVNKEDESSKIDIGTELSEHGLQGLKVTEDELKDLMEQLGLGGDEADDLAKGLIPSSMGRKEAKGKRPELKAKVKEEAKKVGDDGAREEAKEKVKKEEAKRQETEEEAIPIEQVASDGSETGKSSETTNA